MFTCYRLGVRIGLEQSWQGETDPALVIAREDQEIWARKQGWWNVLQCLLSIMSTWAWERQQPGIHVQGISLWLDWHFPICIFSEAFSPMCWLVPSLKIVADDCQNLWLQCVRLCGLAAMPTSEIIQGIAEHQSGEDRGESLGTGLTFEWSGKQILPLSFYFHLGLRQMEGWEFIVIVVKKKKSNAEYRTLTDS